MWVFFLFFFVVLSLRWLASYVGQSEVSVSMTISPPFFFFFFSKFLFRGTHVPLLLFLMFFFLFFFVLFL